MVVDEIIAGNARRKPDDVGWSFEGQTWRWREINERVNRCAQALLGLGLVPGDRVALISENSHQVAELYFAIPRAGLIIVPINPLSVRREIDYVLRDVGARALLISTPFVNRLEPIAELLQVVDFVIGIEADAALPQTIEQLMATVSSEPPSVKTSEDAVRAIKYTSGTTGAPKGCLSTHKQFLINILNYFIQMPFSSSDRVLLCLPMTAGVGIAMLTAYTYLGLSTVILRRFKAGETLDAIAVHKITRMYAVPTLLAALADEQEARPRDLNKLKLIGYGGQAAPQPLILRVMNVLGCSLYQVFGASETGGFVSYFTPQDHERLRCGDFKAVDTYGRNIVPCGREVQGFHLRVVDDEHRDLPVGQVGELAVRSDSNFSGYWNRPEQSAEVLVDGWLYTGDLAVCDPEGYYYVVDRKRDMIKSGGLSVYSAEVEAALQDHPAVAEAAVIGVADPYWGEKVHAYIVVRDGATLSEEEIARFSTERLASYKRPKRFIFLDKLPRTSSGKLRKVELRAIP